MVHTGVDHVPPREERCARRRAHRLHVVVLQQRAAARQRVDRRRRELCGPRRDGWNRCCARGAAAGCGCEPDPGRGRARRGEREEPTWELPWSETSFHPRSTGGRGTHLLVTTEPRRADCSRIFWLAVRGSRNSLAADRQSGTHRPQTSRRCASESRQPAAVHRCAVRPGRARRQAAAATR